MDEEELLRKINWNEMLENWWVEWFNGKHSLLLKNVNEVIIICNADLKLMLMFFYESL